MSAPIVLADLDVVSREEWLSKRRLGGSDAAAILGLNPYKTRYAVWAEKCGLIPPFDGNENTRWGQLLEPVILAEFAARANLELEPGRLLLQHPKHTFMTATPDAYTGPEGSRATVQCKNVSAHFKQQWEDGLPDSVHVQVMHEIAVAGVPFAFAVGLIGGNRLMWKTVERDDDLINRIVELEAEFWDLVLKKHPPSVESEDRRTVAAIYPQATDVLSAELAEEYQLSAASYLNLSRSIKSLEKERSKYEAEIKAALGNAAIGRCGEFEVSWKNVERQGYYVKPTQYRKFNIKIGVDTDGAE